MHDKERFFEKHPVVRYIIGILTALLLAALAAALLFAWENPERFQQLIARDQALQNISVTQPGDDSEVSYEASLIAGAIGDIDSEEGTFVVESPVASAEECTQYEKFDATYSVCYFTCETEESCDILEEKIDTELDGLESAYDDFTPAEFDGELASEDILARYDVSAGEVLALSIGEDKAAYRDVWRTFAAISPDALTDESIARFVIYRDAESGTAAFVEPIQGVSPQWAVHVNIDALETESREENILLLIHEFAHILTLRARQVDPAIAEDACTRFFSGEGCARSDSYINAFVENFWSQEDIITVLDGEDGANTLYTKDPSRFVSDYAATNPGEDIAESFAGFVVKQKNDTPTTIAEEKIDFFYNYPTLTQMRSDIRRALGTERAYKRR